MLTIVLGILIVLLIVFLFTYFTNMSSFLVATIAMWSMMGILYLGLFCLLSGYNDWRLVEETPLVSLSNSTATEGKGNLIYVSISAENVYSYRYKIESEIKTENAKTYKVDTKSEADGKITETEDIDCKLPSLRHYTRTYKKSIWTFGLGHDNLYDFYVPEGTIAKMLS